MLVADTVTTICTVLSETFKFTEASTAAVFSVNFGFVYIITVRLNVGTHSEAL